MQLSHRMLQIMVQRTDAKTTDYKKLFLTALEFGWRMTLKNHDVKINDTHEVF